MTVTAFASVSADPPTVLVSLGSEHASARAIAATRRFGVSILGGGAARRRPLRLGAGRGEVPRAVRRGRRRASATPVVAGALAHLDCEVAEAVAVADHTVFFGHVAPRARLARRDAAPLPPPRLPDARRARDAHRSTGRSAAMSLELTARTEPGARLVELAETLADEIGPRPPPTTATRRFPFDSFAAVKQSGYFTAPIPEELGGLGVTSVHDVLVASSRLARGDAALTLGVNMHLVFVLNVVRRWQIARGRQRAARRRVRRDARADRPRRHGLRRRRQRARAGPHPAGDDCDAHREGWIVSGHKVFCTMSPAADVLYTAVTFTDDDGRERYGYAMIPRETPGVVVHDDWDALGMRASGSHSVSFEDVQLPAVGAPRRLPGRRRGRVHGTEPQRRPLPRGGGARHRGERPRDRRRPARPSPASSTRTRRCSRPRTSSTSPPAAPSSRAPPR